MTTISLLGGTIKEKSEFTKCVLDAFFAVPTRFADRKEDATFFAECMKKYLGDYHLIYTRSPEGRKHLIEARISALGNRQSRCQNRKKVKSSLE